MFNKAAFYLISTLLIVSPLMVSCSDEDRVGLIFVSQHHSDIKNEILIDAKEFITNYKSKNLPAYHQVDLQNIQFPQEMLELNNIKFDTVSANTNYQIKKCPVTYDGGNIVCIAATEGDPDLYTFTFDYIKTDKSIGHGRLTLKANLLISHMLNVAKTMYHRYIKETRSININKKEFTLKLDGIESKDYKFPEGEGIFDKAGFLFSDLNRNMNEEMLAQQKDLFNKIQIELYDDRNKVHLIKQTRGTMGKSFQEVNPYRIRYEYTIDRSYIFINNYYYLSNEETKEKEVLFTKYFFRRVISNLYHYKFFNFKEENVLTLNNTIGFDVKYLKKYFPGLMQKETDKYFVE